MKMKFALLMMFSRSSNATFLFSEMNLPLFFPLQDLKKHCPSVKDPFGANVLRSAFGRRLIAGTARCFDGWLGGAKRIFCEMYCCNSWIKRRSRIMISQRLCIKC